jgi:hypothetical protein
MKYKDIPVSGDGMDIREAGPLFMMIEHAVLDDYPDMTPHQFIVYAALLAYAGAEARCIPSIAALARRAHIGTTATKEALNNLVERELVRKIPRVDEAGDPTSNLYVVYRPSVVKGIQGVGRQTTDPRRQTTQGGSADDPGWVGKRPQSIFTEVDSPKKIDTPNPWNESARFLEWWNIYPRRVARPNAEKAFRKHVNESNFGDLMAGTINWIESPEWDESRKQFIPHPTTFLNRHQWNDEPAKLLAVSTASNGHGGDPGKTRAYTREELRQRIIDEERRQG